MRRSILSKAGNGHYVPIHCHHLSHHTRFFFGHPSHPNRQAKVLESLDFPSKACSHNHHPPCRPATTKFTIAVLRVTLVSCGEQTFLGPCHRNPIRKVIAVWIRDVTVQWAIGAPICQWRPFLPVGLIHQQLGISSSCIKFILLITAGCLLPSYADAWPWNGHWYIWTVKLFIWPCGCHNFASAWLEITVVSPHIHMRILTGT